MLKDVVQERGRRLAVKVGGKRRRFPSRDNFRCIAQELIRNIRNYLKCENASSACVWTDKTNCDLYLTCCRSEDLPGYVTVIYDVAKRFAGDARQSPPPNGKTIRDELAQALALIADEEREFIFAYYRKNASQKNAKSFNVKSLNKGEIMEINGVKLPSEKSFNAAARKFRQMFNDGPSLDKPSCYIKLTDGKFECVWERTDEGANLFGKSGLDINVDKIVLTSAFLYSRVFPSPTATIREVRLALALTLARYDVERYAEIAKYYNINASFFEEEWRRRNAEN